MFSPLPKTVFLMKFRLLLFFSLLLVAGCLSTGAQKEGQADTTLVEPQLPHYDYDTLDLDGVLVNGHPVLLSLTEFRQFYPKTDSAKAELWECGNPFEFLDSTWMTANYVNSADTVWKEGVNNSYVRTSYSSGAAFVSNGHLVLFEEAGMLRNEVTLVGTSLKLNGRTTLHDFEKAFPNIKQEEGCGNPEEARFRIYLSKSEGNSFNFRFEKGKLLTVTLWWHLC